jgi:O-antigen ligase
LLFCGYVFCWYVQISARMPALAAIRFELLYALVLAVVALAVGTSITSPLTPYLMALFVCVAIQVPFSHAPELSFNVFVDRVLKFFCMSLFIVAFVKGPRQLRWFFAAYLLACLKLGQEGFTGQITGSLVWLNQGVMRLHGPTPTYEHPNSFAGMALGTVPFVFYLFPIANRWEKAVLLTLAVFAGCIILFTGSRTGYIGFLGFVAFTIWRSSRRFRAVAAVVLVAALTIPFIPEQYTERFTSIYEGTDKEGHSTEMRKEILRDAWQVFQMHPLGVGVGAFPVVREELFGRTQDTHNLYLEVGTNLGIHGLVVFLAFVGSMLAMLFRLGRTFHQQLNQLRDVRQPSPEGILLVDHMRDLAFMRQTTFAVQGFLVMRLVLGCFGMDFYEIYWWFAMGLAIALHKMNSVAAARTETLLASVPLADPWNRDTHRITDRIGRTHVRRPVPSFR